MKIFPINYMGIQKLGAVMVIKESGVWRVRMLSDDRQSQAYSLFEISNMIGSADPEHGMFLALFGFVVEEVEEYTNCKLNRVLPTLSSSVQEREMLNPFFRVVSVDNGPWIADWMLPWLKEGRIVFEDVPDWHRYIFILEEDSSVTLKGDSCVLICRFSGGNSIVSTSVLLCCTVHHANVSNITAKQAVVYDLNQVSGIDL